MRILLATTLLAATAAASAQTITLTLTPSDYNGYNVSCAHAQDGSIDMTVTGGVPPYHFEWSNGDTIEDVSGLSDGYYHVRMVDVNGDQAQTEITLTRPERFNLSVTPAEYPNGYSISCNNCYNGSLDVESEGGVAPYTYLWDDAVTTQDRTALGAGNYHVVATDANGCETESEVLYLSQPERDDWGKSGNAGTNPATQYIGTSDSTDFVFRTNGTEQFRLLANGDIKIFGGSDASGPLYRDPDGVLRAGGPPNLIPGPLTPCATDLGPYPYWETDGNAFQHPQCNPDVVPLLGTRSPHPVDFITDDQVWMRLDVNGKLGIGTVPPPGAIGQYRLFVEGGISTRDVLVKHGAWPDHVFADEYELLPMTNLRAYLRMHQHLPGIPSAKEVDEKGGVEVGDLQRRMLETIEQQALYILQLEERLGRVEQRLGTCTPSK